jgi:hypothetical protein
VSNRFAPLEELDAEVESNSASETVRKKVKESLCYFELKNHKPWFDKGFSKLLDQKKQARLQWLQDTSEINEDNLYNIRCKASKHFRNKRREYLKDKMNDLATNSRSKNISDLYRGIN